MTTTDALTEAEREYRIAVALDDAKCRLTRGYAANDPEMREVVRTVLRAVDTDHPARPGAGAAGERGYGRVAYTAYYANVLAHAPNVSWDDASPTIQAAWGVSANAVHDAVLRDLADPAAGERAQRIERLAREITRAAKRTRPPGVWLLVPERDIDALRSALAAAPDDKE